MKKILYIGNKLKNDKSNLSGIHILGSLLENEGYSIQYASSKSNKMLRLLDMIESCFRYFKRVDIVLIDTYSTQNFYYSFIISQLCRTLKLPYIPILHGGNLHKRLKLHPRKSHLIFKYAKLNVSPSLYLKQAFEKCNYTNVVHIPNALEIDKYPTTLNDYISPKLLWVRSFSKIYNPKLALYVFKKLKDIYPKAELCMVGPDSDGTFNSVKKLNQDLQLNVKFTGKLTKPEWIVLSKDYNIFINTTNFDNMPLSVIEAMALGLPVVSTNVGGIPYLIKDKISGLLVKPNDANDMVKAISLLMNNNQMRESIINIARAGVEDFDWNIIKEKWFEILER